MSQELDAIVEGFLFPTDPKCRGCGVSIPGAQTDSDSRGLVQTYAFTPLCQACKKQSMAESDAWEEERRARLLHLRTEKPCGCVVGMGLYRGSMELWTFTVLNGEADRIIFMTEEEWDVRFRQPWLCPTHIIAESGSRVAEKWQGWVENRG